LIPPKDGALSDDELNAFQFLCFGQLLSEEELGAVKAMVAERMPDGLAEGVRGEGRGGVCRVGFVGWASGGCVAPGQGGRGLGSGCCWSGFDAPPAHTPSTLPRHPHTHPNPQGLMFPGFMYLHTLFLTRGRLESTWTVLKAFGGRVCALVNSKGGG
jgi:hypothetical protein